MADNSVILLKGMGRETDQLVLWQKKLQNAFKQTGAGLAYLTVKGVFGFVKASAKSAKSVEDQEKALSKLSSMQKFAQKRVFQHTRANKGLSKTYEFLNANTDEGNKHFMKMAMGMTTLVGTVWMIATGMSLLAIGIGVVSIALQGQNNWVLEATEGMGALHIVVEGLTEAFHPEGGLNNGLKVLLASLTLGVALFVLVSAPVGILAAGLMLAVYAFNLVKEKTDSLALALAAFGAVMGPFIAMVIWMSSSASGLVVGFVNLLNVFSSAPVVLSNSLIGLMAGFAAIGAGIAGLVYVAMGYGSDLKALVVGVVSGILIAVGLLALGVAIVPAAIVAAVLFVVALLIRKRDFIFDLFTSIVSFILGIMIEIGKIMMKYNPLKMLGGAASAIGGFGKGLFKADGGPVTGGRSYIVGEKGPEMFTPSASGSITPNHNMGDSGGGGQTVNMSINVSGVTDRTDKRDLAREIGDMINQELRRQGGGTTRGRF